MRRTVLSSSAPTVDASLPSAPPRRMAAAALPASPLLAQDQPQAWEQAVRKILGDAKPIEGKMPLELPEIAENGNTVPFTDRGRQPDDGEGPRQGHPHHRHRQSAAGRGDVPPLAAVGQGGRRQPHAPARTQDVIGIAELSDGRFLMTKRPVKVTIGGCGG